MSKKYYSENIFSTLEKNAPAYYNNTRKTVMDGTS